MKTIKVFYVQTFGDYTNGRIAELLGEDVEESICTKKVVATWRDIGVYKLNPDQMKQVVESILSASLVVVVYHDTRFGIVHVADLKKALDAHVTFVPRSGKSTANKIKTQIKKVLVRHGGRVTLVTV